MNTRHTEQVVTGPRHDLQYAKLPIGVPAQSGLMGRAPRRFLPHFLQTL